MEDDKEVGQLPTITTIRVWLSYWGIAKAAEAIYAEADSSGIPRGQLWKMTSLEARPSQLSVDLAIGEALRSRCRVSGWSWMILISLISWISSISLKKSKSYSFLNRATQAAKRFSSSDLPADLVFIDADHSEATLELTVELICRSCRAVLLDEVHKVDILTCRRRFPKT